MNLQHSIKKSLRFLIEKLLEFRRKYLTFNALVWPTVIGFVVAAIWYFTIENPDKKQVRENQIRIDQADHLMNENEYQKALEIYSTTLLYVSPQECKEQYAHILYSEVACYVSLNDEHPNENLITTAINTAEQVRRIYCVSSKYEDSCLELLDHMGHLYYSLSRIRNQKTNLDSSISLINQCIVRFGKKYGTSNTDALSLRLLADDYSDLGLLENPVDNFVKAIFIYQELSAEFKRQKLLEEYANNQLAVANLYVIYHEYLDSSELEQGISAATNALQIYAPENYGMQYADAQIALGNLYLIQARFKGSIQEIRTSIGAFNTALDIYEAKKDSANWGVAKSQLALSYTCLYKLQKTDSILKMAFRLYNESLIVYNLANYPIDYARTQNNLGELFKYAFSFTHNPKYFKYAVQFYSNVLKVYTSPIRGASYTRAMGGLYKLYYEYYEISRDKTYLSEANGIRSKYLADSVKAGLPK